MCSSIIACMLVGAIGAGQGAAPGPEARSARLAHHETGTTLVAQGRWDEAIEHLQKGVDLYPGDGTMRYLLGYSYSSKAYQSGDLKLLEIAITHYQAALKSQPRLAEACNELGTAQRALGQRDQAIESYRKALAINPNWMLPRFNLGEAYSDKGSYAQALAEYRWLLKHFTDAPGSGISLPQIHNAIGEVFDHSDKLEEAATSFKTALADDPALPARASIWRVPICSSVVWTTRSASTSMPSGLMLVTPTSSTPSASFMPYNARMTSRWLLSSELSRRASSGKQSGEILCSGDCERTPGSSSFSAKFEISAGRLSSKTVGLLTETRSLAETPRKPPIPALQFK